MAASGHDMLVVELVEDDVPSGAGVPRGPAPVGRTPSWGTRRPTGRPHRRGRTLGVVALLVTGVALGDAAAGARHRADQAALAGLPGVVAPLDLPVTELWRGDPTLRPELEAAGGLLVGVTAARGAAGVVGLEPTTGAVVWRTVLRDEAGPSDTRGRVRCVAPDPPTTDVPDTPAAGPTPAPATPAPTVVCVVDDARHPDRGEVRSHGPHRGADGPLVRGEAPDGRPAGPDDRLVTLDARTGAVLAERTVERGTVLDELGPDVVTGHVDPAGYLHVIRTDPLGEAVRWSFVTPRPLPRSHLAWATRVGVEDGVVVIDESDGWVLSGDGEVLHSWTGGPTGDLAGTAQVVGAGRYLTRPASSGAPVPRSVVTHLPTGRSFAVAGRPLRSWPDDGSLGDRVAVRTGPPGELLAHDPTGARAWAVEGNAQGRALVLDGRLLRIGSQDLSAVDTRTGAVLWSTPLTRTARTSLMTDGRLALVTRLDPEDGVVLSAYGLDDGRRRWTADLADDVAALVAFGDRLFGWTGEQLVALGRPAR